MVKPHPKPLVGTYRLQLTPEFGFRAAAALADYLAELGVSHLYSSPCFQAAPGSLHSYDVASHREFSEDLGGRAAQGELCAALHDRGLGVVLDIVPNHMSTVRQNALWWDVLENGPWSRFAHYFDVEWNPPEPRLRNRVLLPILGDRYGRVLESGDVQLERTGETFRLRCYDLLLPVAPPSLPRLLGPAAERCGSDTLAFVADAFGRLPASGAATPESIGRRFRDQQVLKGGLRKLVEDRPEIVQALDEVVQEVNTSFDLLHGLLRRQAYRLAFWRTSMADLNYRRFFNIDSLVGVRVEDQRVFEETHGLLRECLDNRLLDGLRVDHPDGLWDPEQYLERLRAIAPRAWIVVEKILEPGERLPSSWPVEGTTGYDFLFRVNGLFVDPQGEGPLTRFYGDFTRETTDYRSLVRKKKHLVLEKYFDPDVNRLTQLLMKLCERYPRLADYTRRELHDMLQEVIACYPVYRTYIRAGEASPVRDDDLRHITEAIEAAKAHRPRMDRRLLDFFREVMLLRVRGPTEAELVMRFQQLTGAAMAKGVEDTTFYNFNRLVSLNEVGSDPSKFACSVRDFHRSCAETQKEWPLSMLATSTHDTKRSEDVRARIDVLSELPERWADAVRRWSAQNERYRKRGLPGRNEEYLLYQTLVGAWPLPLDRALAYMYKATHEAKVFTSWTEPNPRYEDALKEFVEGVLGDADFVEDLEGFLKDVVPAGRVNSLAQTLLKFTTPGVPDTYQGTEVWDLSLVDPDNRRPVDFEVRRRLLARLRQATPEEVLAGMEEGLPKLWVVRQALGVRRRLPDCFGRRGGYTPLAVRGPKANHALAFARGGGAVTLVPRLTVGLGGVWEETKVALPGGRWRNELTGEGFEGGDTLVVELLRRFPVALLTREP